MMERTQWIGALLLAGVVSAPALRAEEVRYVDGEDGVRYQEITQVSQRPVSETRYEQREYTTYRERLTTDLQESQRTYQVPVTENQWIPGYQRSLNPFAPPVLTYKLMPVTRWETRSETVRVPITRRDYIPEKQVQQIPIVTQRLAEERHTHRIPVGTVAGSEPRMATRDTSLGGTKLDPEQPSGNVWKGGLDGARP
jgi:hypothetical protein